MTIRQRSLTLIFLSLITTFSWGRGIELQDIRFFVDTTAKLELKDTWKLNQSNFESSKKTTLNFGLTSSAAWIVFDVDLPNNEHRVLEISNLLLDQLDLYIFQNGNLISSQTNGRYKAFESRHYQSKNFGFDMPRAPGKYTCYLRAKSLYTLSLPLEVVDINQFLMDESHTQLLMGFIFGLSFLILFYNLLLYLVLKDKPSLYYVIYIAIFWFYNSMVAGLDIQYFYPSAVNWPGYGTSIFAALTFFASALFVRKFFQTKRRMPYFDKFFLVVMILGIILAIYPIIFGLSIPYKKVITYIPVLILLPILITGVIRMLQGFKPAIFFVCGWTLLMIGIILYGLRGAAVIESNLITTYGVILGAFGETFLLSLSISYQVSILRKEKDEAQLQQIVYLEEMQEMKDEANRELEIKVKHRTKEVEQQKEELTEKNKQIIDSINYAQHIQQAILPPKEELDAKIKDYFILFKPRDIVSGDFYWFHEEGDSLYLTIADCTGHGVPGAFMSFLGYSLLNEAILEKRLKDPAAIITEMHERLIRALRKDRSSEHVYDSIDLAMIVVNKKTREVNYSGAMRPLYIISKGEVEQIKATKKSVGEMHKEYPYESVRTTVESGDMLYLFSDGYPDQFHHQTNKKFTTRVFRNLLCEISNDSCINQEKRLNAELKSWQGSGWQVDDILVAGIRMP